LIVVAAGRRGYRCGVELHVNLLAL
jgi:hypothetical protein